MSFEPGNLVSDIESVIASRPDKVGAILRRITDLFLSNTEQGAAEQLDVYDDVLSMFVC